jgi:hypothetical protein
MATIPKDSVIECDLAVKDAVIEYVTDKLKRPIAAPIQLFTFDSQGL